jgi:hypothetical protein
VLTSISTDPTSAPLNDTVARQWTRHAQLVFLVGAPRSGTTWLQAMIGSHPSVATGPETHFFKMMGKVTDVFDEKTFRNAGPREYFTPEEFHHALADLFHAMISKVPPPQGPRLFFLEKTPEHCLTAPLILSCFPNARFIHLVRDGRHVVHSLMYSRDWAWGFSATIAARIWMDSVLAARGIRALLADTNDYYELRYESLRLKPQEEMTRLFDWMGLEIDPPNLERIVAKNALKEVQQAKTFSAIRRPDAQNAPGYTEPAGFFGKGAIDSSSFGLTRLQEYQCYRTFGDLLYELGYVPKLPAVPLWATFLCSWKVRRCLGLGPV